MMARLAILALAAAGASSESLALHWDAGLDGTVHGAAWTPPADGRWHSGRVSPAVTGPGRRTWYVQASGEQDQYGLVDTQATVVPNLALAVLSEGYGTNAQPEHIVAWQPSPGTVDGRLCNNDFKPVHVATGDVLRFELQDGSWNMLNTQTGDQATLCSGLTAGPLHFAASGGFGHSLRLLSPGDAAIGSFDVQEYGESLMALPDANASHIGSGMVPVLPIVLLTLLLSIAVGMRRARHLEEKPMAGEIDKTDLREGFLATNCDNANEHHETLAMPAQLA